MKTKDQMDFIVMELHTGQQFWWIGGPDDDSEGKCVWWHSNQDVETFLGAEDILDHNLKETFNVNVVALTFMNHTTFASKIFNLQKRVFVFSFLDKSKISSLQCFESERKIDPS